MKVTKIIISDGEGNEQEFNIVDAVVMAVTEDQRILTQTSENASLNMQIIKHLLKE